MQPPYASWIMQSSMWYAPCLLYLQLKLAACKRKYILTACPCIACGAAATGVHTLCSSEQSSSASASVGVMPNASPVCLWHPWYSSNFILFDLLGSCLQDMLDTVYLSVHIKFLVYSTAISSSRHPVCTLWFCPIPLSKNWYACQPVCTALALPPPRLQWTTAVLHLMKPC